MHFASLNSTQQLSQTPSDSSDSRRFECHFSPLQFHEIPPQPLATTSNSTGCNSQPPHSTRCDSPSPATPANSTRCNFQPLVAASSCSMRCNHQPLAALSTSPRCNFQPVKSPSNSLGSPTTAQSRSSEMQLFSMMCAIPSHSLPHQIILQCDAHHLAAASNSRCCNSRGAAPSHSQPHPILTGATPSHTQPHEIL